MNFLADAVTFGTGIDYILTGLGSAKMHNGKK